MLRSIRWQTKSENIMVMAAMSATDVVLKAVPISPTTVGSFSDISLNEMPESAVPKWMTVPRKPSTGVMPITNRINT